jgi:hypothetical protein
VSVGRKYLLHEGRLVLRIGFAVAAESSSKIMLESRVTPCQNLIAPKSITEGEFVQVVA